MDIVQELKALKPDEPDDEVASDVAKIRQAKPGISDDEILQNARAMVGKPPLPAAAAPGVGAPPARVAAMPAGGPSPAPTGAPAPSFGISARDAASAALQGLAGVGDAIARSYGGDKDANHLKEAVDAQQAQREIERNAPLKVQEQQKGALEIAGQQRSAQDLTEMRDPTSTRSQQLQASARPILLAAGYKDEDIKKIPGEMIDQTMKDATSFADAKARWQSLKDSKSMNLGLREDQQQDRLEQQARQAVQSLRGDKSLADAEAKRDASITVYNTIQTIKDQGRMPSKLEYYDLLGQMWKARTGSSPSDQAIKDLDSKTFKGDISKAATYFTGQPVGATTEGVLDNIQGFAKDSGLQADKFHQAYMKTHLLKPKDLSDDRWQPILQTGRGASFAEATGATENAPAAAAPGAPPTVSSQADYDKLPSGAEYLDPSGTRRRKK